MSGSKYSTVAGDCCRSSTKCPGCTSAMAGGWRRHPARAELELASEGVWCGEGGHGVRGLAVQPSHDGHRAVVVCVLQFVGGQRRHGSAAEAQVEAADETRRAERIDGVRCHGGCRGRCGRRHERCRERREQEQQCSRLEQAPSACVTDLKRVHARRPVAREAIDPGGPTDAPHQAGRVGHNMRVAVSGLSSHAARRAPRRPNDQPFGYPPFRERGVSARTRAHIRAHSFATWRSAIA